MSTYRIRLAKASEREALEALQWRASLALNEHNAQLLANPDAIELPAEQIDAGAVMVAQQDAAIIGFAVLLIDDNGAELDGLFVEPERWRQGIGSALVEAAAHRARVAGRTLMVVAGLTARGFYESCGFTTEGGVQTRFGPALRMSR